MRTAGLTMNDVWAHRVLRERGVETYRLEGVTAELDVMVESLDLKHRGKEENYRPYLHMTGELRSVTPVKALPFGISQVTYSPGQGEKVDAFYEFNDQQLVALASKGYFTSGFAVPEQVTGIEWELPATADMLVLAPSGCRPKAMRPWSSPRSTTSGAWRSISSPAATTSRATSPTTPRTASRG
ncbi:hypothetical protein SAZ11_07635 [Streptomyces sp. FXJ1.4098]|nr:hypothetical protein [Streptomyces sp. FXJ1.4098]